MPITDPRMTRFWITLQQGVDFVLTNFERMYGGEIFIPKIPSMRITDLTESLAPKFSYDVIGIRPGEKLHEQMISAEDAPHTYEYAEHFKVLPAIYNWSRDLKRISGGKLVHPNFSYASDNNPEWMTVDMLTHWITQNQEKIGNF